MTVADKEKIMANKKDKLVEKEVQRFHTGDWTLDCIMSNGENDPNKGFPIGKVIHLWGGSKSGKSFLCLNAIREMLSIYGKDGADYLWLDVEEAFSFDTEELYGFSVNDGYHIAHPKTVSQWQATIETFALRSDKNKPKILCLDSLDTLTTIEELERKNSRVASFKKTKGEDTGKQNTYGMEKAKRIGEVMRTCLNTLSKYNIALFVISQERSNVNAGMFEKKTVVSGGKAKDYFATIQMEVKQVETYGEEYREYGSCVQVVGAKTRTPYEGRRSFISLYYNMGFDPISSGIDALYDLRNEYGKLDTGKAQCLKWIDEFDVTKLDGEAVPDADIKKFAKDQDIEGVVREEYKRLTVKNIMAYVAETPEVLALFVDQFGVMSRDSLIAFIEESEEREEELERRVKAKFYHLEKSVMPVRKSRKLA